MSRRVFHSLAVALVFLTAASPLFAHHTIRAKFDPDKTRTLTGTVLRLDWSNPHVHVLMTVPEGERLAIWSVEMDSQLDLERSGWDNKTLKAGDSITVEGSLARDGSPQVWGNSVTVDSTRRKVLYMSSAAIAALVPTPGLPTLPVPRWPDGNPRLGPPPGEIGYWAKPSAAALMENGANVQMDRDGLLRNLSDIDKVAPFQKWARDLYEYRQRNFLKDDPMFLYCKPPGAIRQFQMAYGNQFIENKEFNRIFLTSGGGNHDWHFIYLDGRPQVGELSGNDTTPLYYGNARGRWEGDTLVVDTKGLNEKFWITNGGLPHTEQLHIVERFTRTDLYHMRYEVTINDLGAYTRPWSASWTLQWVRGEELPTYYCQDNRS